MSKEYLEALNWLLDNEMIYRGRTRLPISPSLRFSINAIQRLESIDNANSSEALNITKATEKYTGIDLTIITQALLKAQEQEKVLKIIKEKQVYVKDIIETENAREYNYLQVYEYKMLTQEEFELLKRWLDEKSNSCNQDI